MGAHLALGWGLSSALAFEGSRTEAHVKVVWTGRCDWDCDSVLARIARLGSFMDTDPAKIRGGVTASCGAMGSLAYGRGCAKLARGR